jgi:hypothetical protein
VLFPLDESSDIGLDVLYAAVVDGDGWLPFGSAYIIMMQHPEHCVGILTITLGRHNV